MAITISAIRENHRSIAFRFTGDGASQPSVNHTRHVRPVQTGKVFAVTGATKFSTDPSGRGGLYVATDGTVVSASVSISGSAVSVTTSPAVTNGTVCDVVVVYDAPTPTD